MIVVIFSKRLSVFSVSDWSLFSASDWSVFSVSDRTTTSMSDTSATKIWLSNLYYLKRWLPNFGYTTFCAYSDIVITYLSMFEDLFFGTTNSMVPSLTFVELLLSGLISIELIDLYLSRNTVTSISLS